MYEPVFLGDVAISAFQASIYIFFKDSPVIHNQNMSTNMKLHMKMRFYASLFPVYHSYNLIWLIYPSLFALRIAILYHNYMILHLWYTTRSPMEPFKCTYL